MVNMLPTFDPRQEMTGQGYEIAHRLDTYMKDVQLHHHDFYEVYFLMSGDVTYSIEGNIYHVLPGDILLISPRELHQLFVHENMAAYERYVLWMDAELLQSLSSPNADLTGCFKGNQTQYTNLLRPSAQMRSTIRWIMEAIYQESENPHFGADVLTTSLLTTLLVHINRLSKSEEPRKSGEAADRLISDVVSYINLHYAQDLSLDHLGERFFVSKYHLSHEFNRQLGISVHKFLQKKRLLIARQLLSQGNKPTNVYLSCGFKDYVGFYRAFKGEYHQSPREYYDAVHGKI